MKKLVSAAVTATLLSGTAAFAEAEYRVGVMLFGLSEYMSLLTKAMDTHPMVVDGTVKLTVLDGRFDAVVQANQMDTLITQQFDAVIFAPIDQDAAVAPIQRARAAGIPVITAVTGAAGDDFNAYIGPSDIEAGRLIGEEMAKRLDGKGNVVIIEGPIGNSPQINRRKGIDEALANHPEIKLLASKTGNWSRAEGLAVMENWLSLYGDGIDGVLAQNDEMGLGAIEAIRAKGLGNDQIKVVAIDGISDGLKAVKDYGMFTLARSVTFEGQAALDLALGAVIGAGYEPKAAGWTEFDLPWNGGTDKLYGAPWFPVYPDNVAQFQAD